MSVRIKLNIYPSRHPNNNKKLIQDKNKIKTDETTTINRQPKMPTKMIQLESFNDNT